jgi:hypothetical protein
LWDKTLSEITQKGLRFSFNSYDQASRIIWVKILNTLARYANIDDLSIETLTPIVLNQGLRSKIANIEDELQKQQLVEEAFVEEHRRILDELEESKRRESQLSDNISRSAELINELRTELFNIRGESKRQIEAKIRMSFAFKYMLVPSILYIIILIASETVVFMKTHLNFYDIACLFSAVFLLHINVLCWKGMKKEELRTWPLLSLINKFKRSILFVILLTIVGNLLTKIPENSSVLRYFGAKPSAVGDSHPDKQELQPKGSPDNGEKGAGIEKGKIGEMERHETPE